MLLIGCQSTITLNSVSDTSQALIAFLTLVAVIHAMRASRQATAQLADELRIRKEFQRKRVFEKYLLDALHVVEDIEHSAATFMASWEWDESKRKAKRDGVRSEPAVDERRIRQAMTDQWHIFRKTLRTAIAVIRNNRGI